MIRDKSQFYRSVVKRGLSICLLTMSLGLFFPTSAANANSVTIRRGNLTIQFGDSSDDKRTIRDRRDSFKDRRRGRYLNHDRRFKRDSRTPRHYRRRNIPSQSSEYYNCSERTRARIACH